MYDLSKLRVPDEELRRVEQAPRAAFTVRMVVLSCPETEETGTAEEDTEVSVVRGIAAVRSGVADWVNIADDQRVVVPKGSRYAIRCAPGWEASLVVTLTGLDGPRSVSHAMPQRLT